MKKSMALAKFSPGGSGWQGILHRFHRILVDGDGSKPLLYSEHPILVFQITNHSQTGTSLVVFDPWPPYTVPMFFFYYARTFAGTCMLVSGGFGGY